MPFVGTAPIVESGSNANGEYTQYADGTLICRKVALMTTNVNTAVGSLFRNQSEVWTFPVPFVGSPPATSREVMTQIAYGWSSMGSDTTTITRLTYCVMSATSYAYAPYVNLLAIGRWK